jgi:hypothetical protein
MIISSFLISSFAVGTSTVSDIKPVKDLSCASNAVEKRETSIISAHDSMNTSIKNALIARKDSLKTAWSNNDKTAREASKKLAWSSFKTAGQSAHNTMREARKLSWNTFNTDMKACGWVNHGEKAHVVGNPTYAY